MMEDGSGWMVIIAHHGMDQDGSWHGWEAGGREVMDQEGMARRLGLERMEDRIGFGGVWRHGWDGGSGMDGIVDDDGSRIVDRDPASNPPGWNMVGRCHSRGTTMVRAYFRRSQETFTPLLSYY